MTIASHKFGSNPGSPVAQPARGEPATWRWPVAPAVLSIYDKYSQTESVLRADDAQWMFVAAGDRHYIDFAAGSIGQLQRQLVLSIKKNSSAKDLRTFASFLVHHWTLAMQLLASDETTLPAAWCNITTGGSRAVSAMKTLLRHACTAEVGPWRAKHIPVIDSLSTGYGETAKKKFARIDSRSQIITTQQQAQLVHVLDAAAKSDDLSEDEVEGAMALALIFQHGVRTVQVLCLDLHHVQFFNDANGDLTCVVSFHAAKQQDGHEFELLRQVRPEWVAILARQHAIAASKGRTRLCISIGAQRIWLLAARLAKRFGIDTLCSSRNLRHTAAQLLADAGHSRASIQSFLGHTCIRTAAAYVEASMQQAELINTALGASKLYSTLLSFANREFVSLEDVAAASEHQQIGAVVGDRLVAGVGICKSGQDSCAYNPVTSCYGCPKFMPSLDRASHIDAVDGMRSQVTVYLQRGIGSENAAYRQLTRALAGAQEALACIDNLEEKST